MLCETIAHDGLPHNAIHRDRPYWVVPFIRRPYQPTGTLWAVKDGYAVREIDLKQETAETPRDVDTIVIKMAMKKND